MNTEDYLRLMLHNHGSESTSNQILAAWLKQQKQQQPPQIIKGCRLGIFVEENVANTFTLNTPSYSSMTNGHPPSTRRKGPISPPYSYKSFPQNRNHDLVSPTCAGYDLLSSRKQVGSSNKNDSAVNMFLKCKSQVAMCNARPWSFSCEPASNGSILDSIKGSSSFPTDSQTSIRNKRVANAVFPPLAYTVETYCDSNFNQDHYDLCHPPASSPHCNKMYCTSRVEKAFYFPSTVSDLTEACNRCHGISASDDETHNVSRQNSPPLSPFSYSGYAESSSPLSNTPLMFARYFLRERNLESGHNLTESMPPPPLCRENNFSQEGSSRTKVGVKCSKVESEQLSPKSKKKSMPCNSKPKMARKKVVTKPKLDASLRSNSHYCITPSSATIVALSAEVRNKVGSYSANDVGCSTSENDHLSAKKNEAFSIPKFAATMEASQTSQQNIHEWDKQFGLRRAHSKTMRESARSRTKVLEFLKGEGANLLKGMIQLKVSNGERGLLGTEWDLLKSKDDDSIGSFSHDCYCDGDERSSVIDFEGFGLDGEEDEELTKMLRRASLDICSRRSSLVTPMLC